MPVFDNCTKATKKALVAPNCKASPVKSVMSFGCCWYYCCCVFWPALWRCTPIEGPNLLFHVFLHEKRKKGELSNKMRQKTCLGGLHSNASRRMKPSTGVWVQAQKHIFCLNLFNLSYFFPPFLSFSTKNYERALFDQPLEYAANNFWSKYTIYCKIKIKWKSFVCFLCSQGVLKISFIFINLIAVKYISPDSLIFNTSNTE